MSQTSRNATPDRVRFFAGQYGDALIDRAQARSLLQATPDQLECHIGAGLPCLTYPDGDALGYCDVMNLGLYSQSRRSIAEIAERYIARFGEQDAERWADERMWQLTISRSCPAGCDRGTTPSSPEQGGRAAWVGEWRFDTLVDGSGAWALEVSLSGACSEVRSSRLRTLYHRLLGELLEGAIRYQYLPGQLRSDAAQARRLGVADCMTTARTLQAACEEAAIPSRIRLGYLLGIMPVEHAWLEAQDEGAFKPLDPVLAALVARSAQRDCAEEIAAFCLGSTPNWLLPWPSDAHSPLHEAGCEHQGAQWRMMAAPIRRAPRASEAVA